jgi:hypothetical protein
VQSTPAPPDDYLPPPARAFALDRTLIGGREGRGDFMITRETAFTPR